MANHSYVIKSRHEHELGLKSYVFMENDKIISHTNIFQHSAEILSEWKTEFMLSYLGGNFKVNAIKKTNNKVPSNILPLYKVSSWISHHGS